MSNSEKMFDYRQTLLMEMEKLGEQQHSQEISYEEYCEEFQKRNNLYHKLLQESDVLDPD